MSRLRRLSAALLPFVLAAACGPGSSGPPDPAGSRPNIVLVVLCSWRADHMGAWGYEWGLTPFLDRLAAEGVSFENAVSASSWTKPSSTSLLTGLTPNVHGMVDFYRLNEILERRITPKRVLPGGFETLPEVLAEAGYATACRVNNVHAGAFFGLTQGCADELTRHGMTTGAMVDDLEAWLGRLDGRRPFFFLLFSRDAHTPYNPSYESYVATDRSGAPVAPEAYREYRIDLDRRVRGTVAEGAEAPADLQRRWVDLYDAQLPEIDRALARLPGVLQRAGAAGDTWIVLTADHGERFFEHGLIGHGGLLDEPVLEVPLILHGPGAPAGLEVSELVRSIDLYPTLAELAGAPVPPVLQGESLLPLLRGEARSGPVSAFSSTDGDAFALRQGRYKLLLARGAAPAVYDLEEDPGELVDLAPSRPDLLRRLSRELSRWRSEERTLARLVAPAGTRELSPEVLEELRSLGYLD